MKISEKNWSRIFVYGMVTSPVAKSGLRRLVTELIAPAIIPKKRKPLRPGGGRAKGHAFERWVANELKEFFPNASRQLEYQMADCKGIDIRGAGLFRIQCKRFLKYAPIECIEEIQDDGALGEIKLLVTQANGKEPMAVLPWKDFKRILRHGLVVAR